MAGEAPLKGIMVMAFPVSIRITSKLKCPTDPTPLELPRTFPGFCFM